MLTTFFSIGLTNYWQKVFQPWISSWTPWKGLQRCWLILAYPMSSSQVFIGMFVKCPYIMAFHLNVPKLSCINPSFIIFRNICLALNLTKSTYYRYGRWLWLGLELICVHACQLRPWLDPYITMLLNFLPTRLNVWGKLISCTT
jgi:hypothetical protein